MTSGDAVTVAAHIADILERLGIRYAIGGSIASSIAGEPRGTIDVDIVVALSDEDVQPLLSAVEPEFYVSEAALRRAIAALSAVNLVHDATNIKVDLFVAGGTPLDHQQLTRRERVELLPGRRAYVNTPEDILLQKLRWYRRGGEVSDRQWRDVIGIIRTQGVNLDRDTRLERSPHAFVDGRHAGYAAYLSPCRSYDRRQLRPIPLAAARPLCGRFTALAVSRSGRLHARTCSCVGSGKLR